MQNLRQLTSVLAVSGLLACGGGGGATAPTSPAPAVPGGPFDLLFTGLALPHAGQLLSVVVIKDADGSAVARDSRYIADDGSFSLSWSDLLEGGSSYHLDFFADHDSNGKCDPPPVDHAWQDSLGTVTGAVTHHFEHTANFVDVCASFS